MCHVEGPSTGLRGERVRGASKIALSFGVSPLVIGLTVVAYGTSAPEMAVSVQGAVSGQVDIAIGNVVGSNTFNILAVRGASSLVAHEPLAVAPSVLALDLPVMTAVAVACFPVFFTGADRALGRRRLPGLLRCVHCLSNSVGAAPR